MATTFLVIAPNVIVFERLKADFGDGATFRRDPLIPREWAADFDLSVLLQDDLTPASIARRYLPHEHPTTLRPLTRSKAKRGAERGRGYGRSAGQPRSGRREGAGRGSSSKRIASGRRVMVVNDEAHHVHGRRSSSGIRRSSGFTPSCVNPSPEDTGAGVVSQLDFSATPKYREGPPVPSRRRGLSARPGRADGIVKTPLIGEVTGRRVELGDPSFQRNRQWLDVAVGRWRMFNEALSRRANARCCS